MELSSRTPLTPAPVPVKNTTPAAPVADARESQSSTRLEKEPGDDKTTAKQNQNAQAQAQRQALLEQQEIKALAARDREVRAHEAAHMAVGGPWAGAASYTYERGPDGVNYAVGGEVPISTSPAATPELTIVKAQTVRRAALAPAEPSPADYAVAAEATRMEAEARQQLAELRAEENRQAQADAEEKQDESLMGKAREDKAQDDTADNADAAGKDSQPEPGTGSTLAERNETMLRQAYTVFSAASRSGLSVTA